MKKAMNILKTIMTEMTGVLSIPITIQLVYFWGDVFYKNLFTNIHYECSFLEWASLVVTTFIIIGRSISFLYSWFWTIKTWIKLNEDWR